jgi:two-component sensor histidine kinase
MPVQQWLRNNTNRCILLFICLIQIPFFNCTQENNNKNNASVLKLREISLQLRTSDKDIPPETISEARKLAAAPEMISEKIDFYVALGYYYWDFNQPGKGFLYFDTAQQNAAAAKIYAKEVHAGVQKAQIRAELNHPDEAEKIVADLLQKSLDRNDSVLIARCLDQQGILRYNNGKYEQARQILLQEETYLNKDTAWHALAGLYNNLGAVYFKLAAYQPGTDYFERSVRESKLSGDTTAMVTTYINIGLNYNELGFYDLATAYLLKALPLAQKKQLYYELGMCYSVLGNTHLQLSDTVNALKYQTLSLQLREKDKNLELIPRIAESLTNMGEVYLQKGDYEKALNSLEQALQLINQTGSKKNGYPLNLIGQVWFAQKEETKAAYYFNSALGSMLQAGDRKGEAEVRNNLARLYIRQHKFDDALTQLKQAEEISRQSAAQKVLLTSYKIRHSLLRARSEWEHAVALNDTIASLDSSLFNEQKDKTIKGLNIRYNTAENERKIEELNKDSALKSVQIDKKNVTIALLASGISLLLLLVLFAVYAYRSKQKSLRQSNEIILQKQQLIEQKQYMLSELHHRIKNNLQVLATLLSLQQKRLIDTGSREALKAVENRLDAMLLIHKGLYGNAADGTVEMNSYIEKLVENLTASYAFEQLHTTLQIETIRLDADIALNIGFVANEIISNALKHAFKQTANPQIKVQSWQEQLKYRFIFTDNGCGIPPESNTAGNESFGLKLIRILIQQMHGTLEIRAGSQGTTFEIEIPVNQKTHEKTEYFNR